MTLSTQFPSKGSIYRRPFSSDETETPRFTASQFTRRLHYQIDYRLATVRHDA
ncbi:hypothetical protein M404DRAFT_995018 [Pisolithus tinctorius Marx 270]|uniref:Uncharacterized protein n=1 Tax=Pisolithus tinctorius Marx 270 TaxID=870435 RepID=A0A0C3PC85_PISTI|nr:hypothetical protein M404DRAFT_995018 [Pisolithus tinctorius Marx 270]